MTKTFGLMLASALFAAPLYAQDGYYEEEPAAVQKEVQREASQPADVQQAATAAATEASAPAASNEGPKFTVAGEVEFEANTDYKKVDPRDETNNNAEENKWFHDYASTFNLVFGVQFTDKWSAEAAISADGDGTAPHFAYDGAFIQYQLGEGVAIKAGDFTYAEGAFRYYDYDDPGDYAIGMVERNTRGLELNAYGLVLGLGWGRDDDDCSDSDVGCTTYDFHAAYELALGNHTIRPFFNYKSYQTESHNSLRFGVTANLALGSIGTLQLVYGLKSDALTEDTPKMTHALAAEPEFNFGKVSLKATVFKAFLDDDDPTDLEVPEHFFVYAEPVFGLTENLSLGAQVELHSMTLDTDADLSQLWLAPKAYYTVSDNFGFDGYFCVCVPMGDDYGESDEMYLVAGASVALSF